MYKRQDLSDAEKRAIAGHFAWAEEVPPSTFGALKLPHHQADGKVNWRGVVAATARLNQADIPSADLAAVKAHLRRHYAAFGHPIPEALKATIGEEKRGRALSKKNELLLQAGHGHATECMKALDAVLEAVRQMPPEEPDMPDMPDGDPCAPKSEVLELADVADVVVEILDAEPVLELAEDLIEIEGVEIDRQVLAETLRTVVAGAMSEMARTAVERAMNQMRGRVD